jgi:subtilisin family serine protease
VSYDSVISVAALDADGTLSSFSNYGTKNVDLGAPGNGIHSTFPVSVSVPLGYALLGGTSMATPHVTGGAALYASTHPTATAENIKDAILQSVTWTPSLHSKTATGGRLNIAGF